MNNSIPDNNRTRAQFNAYIGTYLSFRGYLESYSNAFEVLIKENYGIEIDKEDIKDFEMYCKDVEKLTNIFHSLDKSSDSFRYSVDRNNNNSFDYKETINLLDIKELFDRSIILLKFTTSLFEKYTILVDKVEDSYIHSEMINI
ncbi:hypothetical protein [Capnocytophaga sp. oral taxon 864]|uniref:hypothetical protein n=1 Tax=Capnocytophaga sp. oral taxon 864 TaxID=1316593 RepID=UPI0020C1E62F|nr:hypothetical protein [Capnocytophaga sp. oral taxon 864]